MLDFNFPWLNKNEKLVCLGDSLTASGEYIKFLRQHLDKFNIETINSGLGGDKTPVALTRLKTDVLDHNPDAVCVFLGTNDAVVGRGEWADEPIVSPNSYRCNLIWIIHLCKLAEIKKFSIVTPAHCYQGEAFYLYGNILSVYCQKAREAADHAEARLVPLDAAFANYNGGKLSEIVSLYSPDGIHMTEKGNRLIAKTMLNAWKMNGCADEIM